MTYQKKQPAISNMQYTRRLLQNGKIQLDINGHIDNEYFEATAIVSQADADNDKGLNQLLTNPLLQAREKTIMLKKNKDSTK